MNHIRLRIACLAVATAIGAAWSGSAFRTAGTTTARTRTSATAIGRVQPTPCGADQLQATIAGTDGATGHGGATVVVSNASATPCTITGPTILELVDARGEIVSQSKGRKPFMASPEAEPHRIILDASPVAEDGGSGVRRFATVVIAQGGCPGGVFPEGGHLRLLINGTERVMINGFAADLPYDYRCDVEQPPPTGPPQLLVGDLLEPEDVG